MKTAFESAHERTVAKRQIAKKCAEKEVATNAVQRGGSLVRDKLLSKIKQLKFELLLVSKLAADTPMFYSPLNAHAAKAIRDKVLENQDEYVIK